MGWRINQRLGQVLFTILVSVSSVYSFLNNTSEDVPEIYANVSKGNTLWESLITDCKDPTVPCIQNNMYLYLNKILQSTESYELGGVLKLIKNNVTYEEHSNEILDGDEEEEIARSAPLEEVTGALKDKAFNFMMTHDMQVQLPDTLFEGSTLKVSPKYFEGNGLMAKLELLPRAPFGEIQSPRIIKKIKKFIGDKLMNALMAIVLVLALLKLKFMFFMPMVMGVAAAKKLLLKLLLFFFPFLSHLFKLCPYYDTHGMTKFHHHHHQISHLHHVPPHPHHHSVKHPPVHDHHPHYDINLDYYSEGPELTNEFITHRKTDEKNAASENKDDSWFSWFGGQGQETAKRPKKPPPVNPPMNRPLTATEIENLAMKAEKEAVLKVRLQQEHQRVIAENKLLQDQINHSLKMQEKLRVQTALMQQQKPPMGPPPLQPQPPIRRTEPFKPSPNVIPGPISGVPVPSKVLQSPPKSPAFPVQPQIINNKPQSFVPHAPQIQSFQEAVQQAAAITFDPFYSPILEKIDKILVGIGFTEEPCKERIICSMYKNPTKFSPHSNLLSAQLSRDATELQKPAATNSAVIRFYRYVQAARDGQDKRECLRLYPACSINTEL